jgi:hypothetical protein
MLWAFLKGLILTAEVEMMNYIIIPDQSSGGKGRDKIECLSLLFIFF